MSDNTRDVEIRVKAKEETAGVFARVREQLEELKKGAGKGSTLGEFGEILKGGGAVFAVTEISRLLGESAGKASELREEFEKGQISAGEMKEQLIGQIPILGQIFSAGRQIREWWTGDEAALRAANDESDRINESIQRRIELMRESNRLHEEARLELAALLGQTELIGQRGLQAQLARSHETLKEGSDSSGEQSRQKREDEDKKREEEFRKLETEKTALKKNLASAGNVGIGSEILSSALGSSPLPESPGDIASRLRMQTRIAQINKEEEGETKRSSGEKNKITEDELKKRRATDERGAAEDKETQRKDGIDRANSEKDADDRVRAIRAQSREAQLRDLGNELGAELEAINAGATAQIEAIERAAAGAKEKNPERSADIDQQKQREENAVKEDAAVRRAAAARKAANDQADKQFNIESVAASAKIAALQAEASLGGTAKQIELDRAEIAEKYREKREQISKQLREDLTLTQQQRQILQQTLGGLDAQEKREEQIAAIKRGMKFDLAPSDTDRDVSGVALAFRAKNSVDLANRIGTAPGSGPGGAGVGAAFAGGAGGKPGAAAAETTAANTQKSNDLLSQLLAMGQSQTQFLQAIAQYFNQNNATNQPIFQN